MNLKRLKYLFAIVPLSAWFYVGCTTFRPGSSGQMEAVPALEQAAERLEAREAAAAAQRSHDGHDHIHIPANADTTEGAIRGPIEWQTPLTTFADTLQTIIPDSIQSALTDAVMSIPPDSLSRIIDSARLVADSLRGMHIDTIRMRNEAIQRLRQLKETYGSELSALSDPTMISPEMIEMAIATTFAPEAERLRAVGIEIPAADTAVPAPEDLMRRLDGMIAQAEQLNREQSREIASLDSTAVLPTIRPARRPFLDQPISGTNKDSLVYDVRNKMIYIFTDGDIDYDEMNLKGDVIEFNTESKDIYAYGVAIPDSLNARTRPKFTQGGQAYDVDTIRYNMGSHKSIIRNTVTEQGEGRMFASTVKKQPDNSFNMADGWYSTCNHNCPDGTACPHYKIIMYKGVVIPNNKVIFGLAHFELEGVPLYFPFVPFGFFPLATGPSSGFIMPSFGEEYSKGFFIRNGGYYFRISDYVDATVTGGIYTLGSWNVTASTRYMKRYKFSGNFAFDYAQNVIGEKGSADYINSPTYNLRWSHSQDPKFRPGTTFTASVNISSSGYTKHSTTTMQDYLNTQTNSSIAYTKNWTASGRFPGANLSLSFNHSQNSRDSTVTMTFPNASWSIPKFKPLKRANASGKERWYEKISMNYSGRMQGNISTKEDQLFTSSTIENMKFGVSHSLPVSISFNLLNYINFSTNITYNEQWHFKKLHQEWDPAQQTVVRDTINGFDRTYDYSLGGSLSTKIYGMFQMKNQQGWLRAVRHVITPSVSFTYRPDFSAAKFGRTLPYQSDAAGTISNYSPYSLSQYSASTGAASASISFSLQQNLEAKVRSERDTTGVRVIKIIDNLSLSGSYNLLADSMNLSTISFNFSTPITKNFPLKFSGVLDPYAVDENGRRINRFLVRDGKLARLASLSTSFSYSWNKTLGSESVMNDVTTQEIQPTQYEMELMTPEARMDAELRRRQMTATYYDFSIPFNFGFSYVFNYTNTGIKKTITQTLSFNGSVTLTPFKSDGTDRWGINFNAGYDFKERKLTPGTVSIVRDLHCFTMSVNWVPIGYRRSWSFNIRIKANVLRDIKYDKSSSHYDTLYD